MTQLKQTFFTRKQTHTDIFIFKVHTHIKSKETSPSHSLKELLELFLIKFAVNNAFIPWKKGENLDLFVEILDTLHPSIKFTKEEGDLSIAFLDIILIKAEDDTIETDIFYKETNAYRYLHFQSAHPHKIKRNIPFTLAQRITRIVSDKIRCEQRLSELANFLRKCNYPEDLIAKNIERVK